MTPRPKLKIRKNLDGSSPLKTENLHKTSLNWSNYSPTNKQSSVKTIKLDDNYPEIKLSANAVVSPRTRKIASSELLLIKSPSLKITKQNSLIKIPLCDLQRKAEIPLERVHTDYCQKKYSPSQRNGTYSHTDLRKKDALCLNLPSDEFEENLNDSGAKLKNKGITLCSTMESSQVGKTTLTNLSASPQNKKSMINAQTLKELAVHTTLSSPKGDSTKSFKRNGRYKSGDKNIGSGAWTGTAKSKNSKAVHRFTDAVEKAKEYDDGVILQYQFDKQNEEEEQDFLELCEMLQTQIKE